MRQISFADDAIDDVVSGAKRETLRLGEDYRVGEVVRFIRQSGERVGFIKITAKSEVRFRDLGKKDVRTHNSGTLRLLRMRLLSFYPALAPESALTRYQFQFMSMAGCRPE